MQERFLDLEQLGGKRCRARDWDEVIVIAGHDEVGNKNRLCQLEPTFSMVRGAKIRAAIRAWKSGSMSGTKQQ